MTVKETADSIKRRNKLFNEVCKACSNLLHGNHPVAKPAKAYLNSRVSQKNQSEYQFGYYPGDDYLDMLTNIVGNETLLELGLIYPKYVKDGFKKNKSILSDHNLIMPYKDLYGNIIALVGRNLQSDEEREEKISKYKNSAFSKSLNLFGIDKAKRSIIEKDYVIIVEGQFDCITADEYGFKNVVAIGGVALTKFQMSILLRYTNNIYLALDNDDAGRKTINKILKRYSKIANLDKISFPSRYKDLDSYLRKSNDHNALQQLNIY